MFLSQVNSFWSPRRIPFPSCHYPRCLSKMLNHLAHHLLSHPLFPGHSDTSPSQERLPPRLSPVPSILSPQDPRHTARPHPPGAASLPSFPWPGLPLSIAHRCTTPPPISRLHSTQAQHIPQPSLTYAPSPSAARTCAPSHARSLPPLLPAQPRCGASLRAGAWHGPRGRDSGQGRGRAVAGRGRGQARGVSCRGRGQARGGRRRRPASVAARRPPCSSRCATCTCGRAGGAGRPRSCAPRCGGCAPRAAPSPSAARRRGPGTRACA